MMRKEAADEIMAKSDGIVPNLLRVDNVTNNFYRENHKMKHFATLALMVAVVAFVLPTAHAATGTIQSTADIAATITLTNLNDLVFGTFTAPTDASVATWELNGSGLIQTTVTNSVNVAGPTSVGGFTINGTGGFPVTFGATIASNFAAGLTLQALIVTPASPQPLASSLVVTVGGELDIASTAVPGPYTATIDVFAHY